MKSSTHLDQLVVISGMSGSGKHTVFKALEDLGFFCVDNIPTALIPRLLQITAVSGGQIKKLAVVVDVRLGQSIAGFHKLFAQLKHAPFRSTVVFVDASDEVLARRYSETRRVHPLAHDTTLLEGVRAERQQLSSIRAMADLIVDTSDFSVHDLRRLIDDNFRDDQTPGQLRVSVVSFGFKYGLPFNADLVFDVRFLANPHFETDLKPLTGGDPRVVEFMLKHVETAEILAKMEDMLLYLLPKYTDEGKTYLTIAIGCTGGRHRSVMVANEIGRRMTSQGYGVNLIHRDIHRDE